MESRPRFLDEQLITQTKVGFAETMNMNEIPTPESDNCYHECVLTPSPGNGLVMRSKMRNLERRLTVAREALKKLDNWLMRDAQRKQIIEQALIKTEPKQ